MARLPRVNVEGAIYYVTCRGAYNEKLFPEEKDYVMYIELLEKYKKELNFKLFSYVLLPQHLHLLVEPNESTGISDIMRSLNTAYSKWFNSAYYRRGHLFRERFKAIIVEKEPYLLRLSAHIHRNPLRLGLVQNPDEYPYSSCMSYLCKQIPAGWEEIDEILKPLAETPYMDYLLKGYDDTPEFRRRLQRGGILGSKEFRMKVNDEIKNSREIAQAQQPEESRRPVLAILLSIFLLLGIFSILHFFIFAPEIEKTEQAINKELVPVVKKKILDDTEWEVKFKPLNTEGVSFTDKLTFSGGKFISTKFSFAGFLATDYSVVTESDKIVWETFQSSQETSASWRGEVRDKKMQGIFSLMAPGGKRQDFSFRSIRYRKR